jgi:hypothetical protein
MQLNSRAQIWIYFPELNCEHSESVVLLLCPQYGARVLWVISVTLLVGIWLLDRVSGVAAKGSVSQLAQVAVSW